MIHNDGRITIKYDSNQEKSMTLQEAKDVKSDLSEAIQDVEEMKYEMGDEVCAECERPLEEEQVEVGLCNTHEKEYKKDARKERR